MRQKLLSAVLIAVTSSVAILTTEHCIFTPPLAKAAEGNAAANYKVVYVKGNGTDFRNAFETKLNEMAAEGWEYVPSADLNTLIFKKRS